jgi:hypothetical protein
MSDGNFSTANQAIGSHRKTFHTEKSSDVFYSMIPQSVQEIHCSLQGGQTDRDVEEVWGAVYPWQPGAAACTERGAPAGSSGYVPLAVT